MCLYGPGVLMLPKELQMVLWNGRDKAKAYMQSNHWDTRGDMEPAVVADVYTRIYGAERASNMLSVMSKRRKEAEADRRLEEER